MPKSESEKKFYGKSSEYEKEIKNNLKDTFNNQNIDSNYFNGIVEVIIPGKRNK